MHTMLKLVIYCGHMATEAQATALLVVSQHHTEDYPIFISTIADGKVYLDTTEHSPNSPLYKGALFRCINATTGAEIWTLQIMATKCMVVKHQLQTVI